MIRRLPHRPALGAALVLLLAAAGAAHAQLRGPVVGVIDGDTIDVLVDGRAVRVRLAQIDAPERGQPFGTRAKQRLSALAFRQQAAVTEDGRDRWGRVIGTVTVDGRNLNKAMVAEGFAWAYRRYVTDPAYLDLENAAQQSGAGLWADPSPTPPWTWRRR